MTTRRNRAEKFAPGDHVTIFLESRGLTQQELANWLGITQPSVAAMKTAGITRVVALALAAIDRGLKPYEPSDEDMEVIKSLRERAGADDE